MKAVLVGQAPSRTGNPKRPLEGRPLSTKLASLAGISRSSYLKQFDRYNVLDFWPGKNGKGDRFPLAKARERARKLTRKLTGRVVVFVGQRTAEAFGYGDLEPLAWKDCGRYYAALLPYPSGVNRWFSEPSNRVCASEFMERLVEEEKENAKDRSRSTGGKVGVRRGSNGRFRRYVKKVDSSIRRNARVGLRDRRSIRETRNRNPRPGV